MHPLANEIRLHLGLQSKENEKELGIRCLTGNFWGFPDGMDLLNEESILYYEIEEGQHHPDTNVLKYWPVLDENPSSKIILVQWLRKKPKSPNRWKLAQFVARKIAENLPNRFQYIFLEYDSPNNEAKLKELKNKICHDGQSAFDK